MAKCKDPLECTALLKEVEELEEALEEAKTELAFRKYGPELQEQFLAASQ